MSRAIDITGQKFGHWTVIERDSSKKGGNAYWLCLCDCGNSEIRSVRGVDLRSGKSLSCGCTNKIRCEQTGEDLSNQIFGFLTVLYQGEKRKGDRHRHWICQCKCGNITEPISSDKLKSGNTTSCGCITSKGEAKIEKILKENNIKYIKQKTFSDLIGNNNKLKFDFYLPDFNMLIEYQGIQHYEPREQFGGEEQFLLQQSYDQKKREYCEKHSIKLIEVPYTDYKILNKEYFSYLNI